MRTGSSSGSRSILQITHLVPFALFFGRSGVDIGSVGPVSSNPGKDREFLNEQSLLKNLHKLAASPTLSPPSSTPTLQIAMQ